MLRVVNQDTVRLAVLALRPGAAQTGQGLLARQRLTAEHPSATRDNEYPLY